MASKIYSILIYSQDTGAPAFLRGLKNPVCHQSAMSVFQAVNTEFFDTAIGVSLGISLQ